MIRMIFWSNLNRRPLHRYVHTWIPPTTMTMVTIITILNVRAEDPQSVKENEFSQLLQECHQVPLPLYIPTCRTHVWKWRNELCQQQKAKNGAHVVDFVYSNQGEGERGSEIVGVKADWAMWCLMWSSCDHTHTCALSLSGSDDHSVLWKFGHIHTNW